LHPELHAHPVARTKAITSARNMPVDRPKLRAYLANMDDAHTLDAMGLLCPLPVLKARKRLMSLSRGETLTVLADDPAAVIDVPHFCAEAGHALVSSDLNGTVQTYVIRKG
jgi:tRNA 2-thiouridine synthesizing protein A